MELTPPTHPLGAIRIGAVIVSYNPCSANLLTMLELLVTQVGLVVIVDNASENQDEIGALLQGYNLIFLSNNQNTGIAAAQNRGIAYCLQHGSSHVLLLDQDSTPAPNMVSTLLTACKRLAEQGIRISAVGPCFFEQQSSETSIFRPSKTTLSASYSGSIAPETIPTDYLIASGSLIPRTTLEVVGSMDEELFIDRVDTDWCLRAKAKGYQAFIAPTAHMCHQLGEKRLRVWFGRWRFVPVHSPVRHYYMFRNSVLLYSRPHIPLSWILADLSSLLGIALFGIICMPLRTIRFMYILRGLRDGLRGRAGRLETSSD